MNNNKKSCRNSSTHRQSSVTPVEAGRKIQKHPFGPSLSRRQDTRLVNFLPFPSTASTPVLPVLPTLPSFPVGKNGLSEHKNFLKVANTAAALDQSFLPLPEKRGLSSRGLSVQQSHDSKNEKKWLIYRELFCTLNRVS